MRSASAPPPAPPTPTARVVLLAARAAGRRPRERIGVDVTITRPDTDVARPPISRAARALARDATDTDADDTADAVIRAIAFARTVVARVVVVERVGHCRDSSRHSFNPSLVVRGGDREVR